MVNLLFIEDADLLTKPGIAKTLLDPACGTGGMLSVAEDRLRELNPDARLHVYGQELNAETYAICRSDMMLKGQDATNIVYGNSFTEDGHGGLKVDYLLANPPFGVEWKKVADTIRDEAESKGFAGRFGAGLPRINDGSFLFLQHMISKMKPVEQGGSRLAIVFNGSPLFTGARRLGRVGDPPLDHRERLARSRRRPPRPALLQHRHLHLLLGRHQPQAPGTAGQGAARRRPRPVREDAQEPGREAQADQRRPDRRDRPRSTATSPRATGSRSSPTRPSGSCASPSSARSGSAGRSPTTPSPPSTPTRRSPSSTPVPRTRCHAVVWSGWRGEVDRRT